MNFRDSKNMVFFTETDVTDLNFYEAGVACRLKSVLLFFFFFCTKIPKASTEKVDFRRKSETSLLTSALHTH